MLNAKRYKLLIDTIIKENFKNILEIGTCKGDTACEMIKCASDSIYYTGIDLFEDLDEDTKELEKSLQPGTHDDVHNRLMKVGNFVTLYKGESEVILDHLFQNAQHFDFIFIDGGHSYNTVKNDFLKSIKLLDKFGIIFIDDYSEEYSMIGVKRFVDEFKQQFDLEIVDTPKDTYRGYDYKLVKYQKISVEDMLTK